eukprot:SRR837773.18727.p1 GENE.SRR837773.18727~~SRR837773.18727.p1  ORF type:complete len:384 (+),score=7.53 SRR837773.18727:71-1153(+)
MSYEAWRLTRVELRDLLNKYEKAVEEDAFGLLRPSPLEKRMMGEEVLKRRLDAIRSARDTNRRFIEAVVEDLPDLCAGPAAAPGRPVMVFRDVDESVPTLPASSYGSIASVCLHIFRDWSDHCGHVHSGTYASVVKELKQQLPKGGNVLVPGAGLARLAVEIASEGFVVEANEASRLFLTFADYMLNRAPAGVPLYPMAHVFSENFSHDQQYMQIGMPTPTASSLTEKVRLAGRPCVAMLPGDFVSLYKHGGVGHRKFDAIVTCFFLDTVTNICELIEVMDGLLEDGGIWVNAGPLNWRKEARLKLTWEEIVTMWEGLGYEFKTQTRLDCDYHMHRGLKMYTESYTIAISTAVKRHASKV